MFLFMNSKYNNSLKKYLCELICFNGDSTIRTAEEYGIPLKTLEKWITAFNKNPLCFDDNNTINVYHIINNINPIDNYNNMSIDDLKKQLMRKDIEIARLKKDYLVKKGGMGQKVFVTFSKKNMK